MAEMSVVEWGGNGEESVVLKTTLGSCVGVYVMDQRAKVSGLSHIMLPRINPRDPKIGKYADTAIPTLVRKMEERGSRRQDMRACLVGGARMFAVDERTGLGAIGDMNVNASRESLARLGITVVFEETGGTRGRTVKFDNRTLTPDIHVLQSLVPAAGRKQ
jgi:chemotaxis protein CheD